MELGKFTKVLSTPKVFTEKRKNLFFSFYIYLYLFVGGVQVSQGTYVNI